MVFSIFSLNLKVETVTIKKSVFTNVKWDQEENLKRYGNIR